MDNWVGYWLVVCRVSDGIRAHAGIPHKIRNTAPYPFCHTTQRLTKFRCSDHNFEIEVRRHKGVEVNNRQCQMCELGKVEDEFHFLCECSVYATHREPLYNVTGVNSTPNEAFSNDLMPSSEHSVIQALSNILKQASDIRKYHQNQRMFHTNYCFVLDLNWLL